MKKNRWIIGAVLFQSLIVHAQCDDFIPEIDIQHPTCHDYTDGAIDVTPLGGTSPYSVTITDADGTPYEPVPGGAINTLLYGWYYIEVVDASGCVYIDSVELINPPPVEFEYTVVAPSFPGACDGIATVDTVYGYQGGYSSIYYFWSPTGPVGVGENVYMDFCAGNYEVTVIDSVGCSAQQTYSSGSLASVSNQELDQIRISNTTSGYLIFSELPNLTLLLYDLAGNKVSTAPLVMGTPFYLSPLGKGMYLYEIVSADQKIRSGKLVF